MANIIEPLGPLRLGVNIDHVATVRNARGCDYPDPLRAALLAQKAGADGITAHLREDRRHIKDHDIEALMGGLDIPLNFEMAATDEMQKIALRHKPHAVCIVPEKREELTTEGGLNVAGNENRLGDYIGPLRDAGSRISLFIGADPKQVESAARIQAPVIELHSGAFCDFAEEGNHDAATQEFIKIAQMVEYGHELGLEVHVGHGITFETVKPIAALPLVMELNIGHFLIGESIFLGMETAIARMRILMNEARAEAAAL